MYKPMSICLAAIPAAACFAAVSIAQPPDGIVLRDVKGASARPFDGAGRKATCVLFVSTDCPISNKYAPEFGRIARQYGPTGVAFYVVYTDADGKPADAARHWKEFAYPCPGLLDPKRLLVKRAGATTTPESALFTADGKLAYRGRIDDLYVDFGKPRYAATIHDLRRSLDAVLAGRPVPIKTTRVIGCFIYNPP